LIGAQNLPVCTTTHRRDRHPAIDLISLYPRTVQRVITHAWINRELNDITRGTMFDFSLYIDQDGDSRTKILRKVERPRKLYKNINHPD